MALETVPDKPKISSYTILGLVFLIIVILLTGLYLWRSRAPVSSSNQTLENVRIANTDYAGTCAVLIAREKGYFKNEGLNVSLQSYTTGRAALDAVLKGQADMGTSADLPIMFAGMKQQPVAVLATLFVADKDYGIIVRKDKGITSPGDLAGKRIGVALSTSAHFALDAFLNRQKLASTDVKMVDMKPEELANALSKGDIDAASTWEPFLGSMRDQLGSNGLVFSAEEVYDSIYNLSARRDYVTQRPETVKKLLRALIRGGQFCKDNSDEASEFVARSIKADIKKLKSLWSTYRFNLTLDQGFVLILEDEARWAIKNKLVEGNTMPNYLNYLYLDGLTAVSPSSVTVIH